MKNTLYIYFAKINAFQKKNKHFSIDFIYTCIDKINIFLLKLIILLSDDSYSIKHIIFHEYVTITENNVNISIDLLI